MQVEIHHTADAVADAASSHVAETLAGLGEATLALAGGSTPQATHARLAVADIEWSRVTLWLGDERWVPASDDLCNARMVRATLADTTGASLVAPVYGDDPNVAAADYAEALERIWVSRDGEAVPDIVMLGMGDDGHTASLFPATPAMSVTEEVYVANWVEDKASWRLTATMPLLWSARRIVFLVTGERKAEMVARVLGDEEPYPARLVAAGARGDVLWLLDAPAASHL